MTPPAFTADQTVAVALIAAIARQDVPAATRILQSPDTDIGALALHCATVAARSAPAVVWEKYLSLAARDEISRLFTDTPSGKE